MVMEVYFLEKKESILYTYKVGTVSLVEISSG